MNSLLNNWRKFIWCKLMLLLLPSQRLHQEEKSMRKYEAQLPVPFQFLCPISLLGSQSTAWCTHLFPAKCFRSVFHRGFFLQFQKHPKALTQTDLCFSAMKIQIPGREGNFLCLFQSWLVLRHTTDNTLNVSVLTNPGPLTLISPMSRGHAATTFYSMWVWVLQKGVLKAGRRWILLIPSENKLLSQCPEPSTLTSAGLRHEHTDISSH